MAQFLIVHDRITRAKLDATKHIVFVTDPKQGALRPLAERLKVPALDIPPSVGGRFSVLTPVGTLPAALIGIDVKSLLSGAAEMAKRCETAELASESSRCLRDASVAGGYVGSRKTIVVLMPYSDPLRDFAAWFVQLWAESLGKHTTRRNVGWFDAAGGARRHRPAQPGPAVHGRSRGQDRDLRGRRRARHRCHDSGCFGDVKELGYLGGHSLGELIDIEQRATAGALAKRGRPNLTIHLERVDASHVGRLMMLLEIATAYAGQLYGIDAFNQPGVELGKQFAYALLGRPGADAAKKEWDSLPKPRSALERLRALASAAFRRRLCRHYARTTDEGAVTVDDGTVTVDDEVSHRVPGDGQARLHRRIRRARTIATDARWLIWEIGQSVGVQPVLDPRSVSRARPRRDVGGFTVPAMNIRGMSYDTARSIFRTAIKPQCRRAHPARSRARRSRTPISGRRNTWR